MILCIDDDTARFDGLRQWLDRRPGSPSLVVASCSVCILRLLPSASVVLLDYDLDGHDDLEGWRPRLCPTCGENLPDRARGIEYVPEVAASGLPVLVVSASYRENVDRMCAKLRGYGVAKMARHSATETMPEPVWVAYLWAWGVLDPAPLAAGALTPAP
jgi:hypothetical protein